MSGAKTVVVIVSLAVDSRGNISDDNQCDGGMSGEVMVLFLLLWSSISISIGN
jgi:hypothetical protein